MLIFNKKFAPQYGEVTRVSPLVRRLVAPNPSPFTFYGTGTYIIGRGGASRTSGGISGNRSRKAEARATARPSQCEESQARAPAIEADLKMSGSDGSPRHKHKIIIIDPGPAIPSHIQALENLLENVTVSHILITHNHVDHSPAAQPLKLITGADIYGFDVTGQAEIDNHAEEGRDQSFTPDHILKDGDIIEGDGWTIETVHTPGHLSNHLCFALREEKALFSGDHVMGWSTSVVSQPDGNMKNYIASLEKLLSRDDDIYYPTHGAPIENPKPYVRALIAHRHNRENQILEVLSTGATTIPEMVDIIYSDIPPYLHPAAASSLLSHLIHMTNDGRVKCRGKIDKDGVFSLH